MLVQDLVEELELCLPESLLQVEINGVTHDVHRICEDSQEVRLIVDLDEEEREMR